MIYRFIFIKIRMQVKVNIGGFYITITEQNSKIPIP